MRGLLPLFLGIFGTFAFSWVGLTVIPNAQIGALNPQTDEEGGDVYPAPPSGMMLRGARVYAANGCVYCHSQQVRPDYAAADIDRKWGERRSAPRDYLFQPIAFLGQMRTGPDLANVGKRPVLQEQGAAAAATTKNSAPVGSPAPAVASSPVPTTAAATPAASAPAETKAAASVVPAASTSPSASVVAATASASPLPQASPATTSAESKAAASVAASASPSVSVAAATASASPPLQSSPATTSAESKAAASVAPAASASPSINVAAATASASPPPQAAPATTSTAAATAASVAPAGSVSPSASVAAATASASPPAQSSPTTTSTPAATPAEIVAPTTTPDGKPLPYTAAWHHQHLYAPRSITPDSNMPAFRFLYQKRRINGEASPDSLNFAGNANDRPAEGWEIVPTYDAECLVAYLMSRDQSHALKEAKSATAPASSPAPGKEAKK
jgi:cbb3-type cytochrome oxidase cytochrome c subunit